jgi:hypothetical protein
MVLLYFASVVLAIAEALLTFKDKAWPPLRAYIDGFVPGIHLDWITMGLLGVLVLSTALTSLYLSRNDRSLLHRYHSQERRIRLWLRDFQALYSAGGVSSQNQNSITRSILAFEELMIDEHLDWIHITSRDVIAIGG